jgi:hypothetical protein
MPDGPVSLPLPIPNLGVLRASAITKLSVIGMADLEQALCQSMLHHSDPPMGEIGTARGHRRNATVRFRSLGCAKAHNVI